MGIKDAEFLKKLLTMFKMEAREHLNVISTELNRMDKGDDKNQAAMVETMFREAHSLKGAARSVNLTDIVSLCQAIENVFSAWKNRRISLSPRLSDCLHQTVDFCHRLVDGGKSSTSERAEIRNLIHQLDSLIQEGETGEEDKSREVEPWLWDSGETPPQQTMVADLVEPPPETRTTPPMPVASEILKISKATLDAMLLQAEEMIALKIATAQRMTELRDLKKAFDSWKKVQQRRHSMGIARNCASPGWSSPDPFLSSFATRFTALVKAAENDHRACSVQIDHLLDDMKKIVMLPFLSVFEMFHRVVRDLAHAAGKKVELTTEGGEIEIDRRVLEEMKAPLLHLVRNCLDHGIEIPVERQQKKKSACGNVKILVASRDGMIDITVADDGNGIDVAKIKSSAVSRALASQEAVDNMGEQEALQLVFQSGLTTSPLITDISGRGLGLAIVREKVEKLNGTVSVDTTMGMGTTFRMVVPLTLSTFRGVLVRVFDRLFVLPSTNVERVVRTKKEGIKTVENRETIVVDGQPLSLLRLGEVLELKVPGDRQPADNVFLQVVVIGLAEKRMAFAVDEILGEQEVLVKPLGGQLARVRNIMGATVLGNGSVAPLLYVPDLLKSAVKKAPIVAGFVEEPVKRSSVLVVEDSITARMLLKNILESAGYNVLTVVDGVEAITALTSRDFDIVVSDVEMPRMNGFDLTATIRSDKKFSTLPVVLVTALESREDRERGIDVGANAYIVKSSFDQSNLLEVIGRLT